MQPGARKEFAPLACVLAGLLLSAGAGHALSSRAQPVPPPPVAVAHVASARLPTPPPGGYVAAAMDEPQIAQAIELDPPIDLDDGLSEDELRRWERGNAESMKIIRATTPEIRR